MPSEKQIAAARANGAKSRGPVTLQGKRNSSRGSLRHGAYSRTHLITPKFQDFFNARLAGLTAEYSPETGREQALVRLAATLLTRFYQLGASQERTLSREIQRQLKLHPHSTPASALAEALKCSTHAWLKVAECEERMFNQFQRVIRLLASLRRKKIGTNPSKCNKTHEPKIACPAPSAPCHHRLHRNQGPRTPRISPKIPTGRRPAPWHTCRAPD